MESSCSSATSTPDSTTSFIFPEPNNSHWFYKQEIKGEEVWEPFSLFDSKNIEEEFKRGDVNNPKVVSTEGGRSDVLVIPRLKRSVYWSSTDVEVRRCSWFYKDQSQTKYSPYEESISEILETEYNTCIVKNKWNHTVRLNNGDSVTFYDSTELVELPRSDPPSDELRDEWGSVPPPVVKIPKTVKRYCWDQFKMPKCETESIDHLIFFVHGIGPACDFKLRPLKDVVDSLRISTQELVNSHFRTSCKQGIVNRIEVLPISWYNKLHIDTGVDRKLDKITLKSVPRFRNFTNETLLDILFYTSETYNQTIISAVGDEMNRLYTLFRNRNPSFKGNVFLGGHSLGSLILFDILSNQKSTTANEEENKATTSSEVTTEEKKTKKKGCETMNLAFKASSALNYPQLIFKPVSFFALGSPIAMFLTIRGFDTLDQNFKLPTCSRFFNIFHPYDPVAYRIEPLINTEMEFVKPMLIPHHKGRKRMHLELKDTMLKVGTDLKQKLFESVKSTWNSLFYQTVNTQQLGNIDIENEVEKVVNEMDIHKSNLKTSESDFEVDYSNYPMGSLNSGHRIDYALQEAPLEFLNEYIFAVYSHLCYWDSEDTMLMIIKEIYSSSGIKTDSKIPQPTMTIERS